MQKAKLQPTLPEIVQTAFVFAARYVHHRNTGGTLAVCKALSYVWPQLSKHTQDQILRESHEATTNLHEWRAFRGDDDENADQWTKHLRPNGKDRS